VTRRRRSTAIGAGTHIDFRRMLIGRELFHGKA
jgi:hypothetical protein